MPEAARARRSQGASNWAASAFQERPRPSRTHFEKERSLREKAREPLQFGSLPFLVSRLTRTKAWLPHDSPDCIFLRRETKQEWG